MLMPLLEAVISPILTSFRLILLAILLGLLIDFLFPSFSKWTRVLLLLVTIIIVVEPAFEQLNMIQQITHGMSTIFLSALPIMTASFVVAGGAFGLLNFQPAMLVFANGIIFLTEKLLLPILMTALLFDLLSRMLPEIPFVKLAEMLRTTLLGLVSAVVAIYSIFITAGGTMTWAVSGYVSEPMKELVRKNIPIIGSLMTESLGAIGQYSSGASLLAGGWLITTIATVALLPTLQTLLIALIYRWSAAFIEPFATEEIAGVLDDIGKMLFVLCAISFLIAFALIYSAIFSVFLIKLMISK